MDFRTDLVCEAAEINPEITGVKQTKIDKFGIKGTQIQVLDNEASKKLKKSKGSYISFETNALYSRDTEEYLKISKAIAEIIKEFIQPKKDKAVLVVGLGNESMTADSIGPKVIDKIFVTRHILTFLPDEADERMNSVCAIKPSVLGVTGVESADIIKGIIDKTNVCALIVIDALASRRSERMFSTFQITDTGITPGAGVGNKRSALTKETLGIPVIALGVPTVIYASSLIYDAAVDILSEMTGQNEEKVEAAANKMAAFLEEDMVVTPKEIDVIAKDSAKIIADGINLALNQDIPLKEMESYMF